MKNNKINIVTLGCSKNLVDSEHIAARCKAAGFHVVFDSNSLDARVVVVNTCGFIGDAKEESIDTILGFAEARSRGEIDKLYVIGCLSERYAADLRAEIPEVDSFFGARTFDGVLDSLGVPNASAATNTSAVADATTTANTSATTNKSTAANASATAYESMTSPAAALSTRRLLSTPSHYAYLKISEGCDRRCGFCAIPLIRGNHVSVPMEQLVDEAQELAKQGVRELIVIAQDTTYYGLDLYGERLLAELLRQLARIEGIEWIRLHYAYPAGFPGDVIEVMRTEPKICKYLDIPLQHIAEGQLRSMKRGLGAEGTRSLVQKLRAEIPGLAIRTTMLVGYPGESEADFEELLKFVGEARFERLGVFAYSAEEGTYSAEELPDDVPDEIKQRRVERIMELQAQISAQANARRVGRAERVIVDRKEGEFWVCRSQWDSPEVDTEILVTASRELSPGEFVTVRITDTIEYDLTGIVEA